VPPGRPREAEEGELVPRALPERDLRRGEAEVEDDDGDAGGEERLGGKERLLQCPRPDPEEARQVGAGGRGGLRVEVVAEVDEGRRLARLRRRGEDGEGQRETSGGAPPVTSTSAPRGRPPGRSRSSGSTAVGSASRRTAPPPREVGRPGQVAGEVVGEGTGSALMAFPGLKT